MVDHGGRVIKTIGDEIMFTADDPVAATEIALALTERGLDEDDPFPNVRAGIAYGLVVKRLGDVYGSTVNVASRLTSVARPGSVVVDRGAYAALSDDVGDSDNNNDQDADKDRDQDRPDEDASAPDDVPGDESGRSDGAPAESPDASSTEQTEEESADPAAPAATRPDYRLRRLRRVSVKGYSRLEAWRVRRPKGRPEVD